MLPLVHCSTHIPTWRWENWDARFSNSAPRNRPDPISGEVKTAKMAIWWKTHKCFIYFRLDQALHIACTFPFQTLFDLISAISQCFTIEQMLAILVIDCCSSRAICSNYDKGWAESSAPPTIDSQITTSSQWRSTGYLQFDSLSEQRLRWDGAH